jgi:predicted nucleotidyltransferase
MEESDFRELIQEYAMQVRMNQGEASLTSVLKQVIAENPDMKAQVRSSVALIKEVITEVNLMEEDDLSDDVSVIPGDEASEYEMLVKLVLDKMTNHPDLKDHIESLMIYGSYAKRLHVVGESDINFLIVLKAEETTESAVEIISQIAESIVTPEIAHIFDLMILKTDDLNELEKFGPDFTHIHGLYAKDGEVLYGENLFVNLNFTDEQIQEAAKILMKESIAQIQETIQAGKDEGLPDDELDYLIGSSIIDIAFSLSCYKAGLKSITMDLVKPDIHEEIVEVWGSDSEFSEYYPLFEKAHAFKLGIKLPDSDNFLEKCYELIKKVIDYTKLQWG